MKKISNLLMMALLTVGMGLTSCEDILGHWEKPTPAVNPTPTFDALSTPLTFEAVSGTLTVTIKTDFATGKTIEYSTDDGATWTEGTPSLGGGSGIDNCANPVTITGSKVLLRGTNATYAGSGNYTKIVCDADCYIYGNVMSLIDKDNFATDATPSLTGDYAFRRLFDSNDHLYSHDTKELLLPATTLTKSCYEGIFIDCTGLTTAPALPAETLALSCYESMFNGCTGLTTAPALPATTLAAYCYTSMFNGCTSLTKAPKLPATTLPTYCYYCMFQNCSNLNEAWVKAAFTTYYNQCKNMFNGAATSGSTLHTTATNVIDWNSAGIDHKGNLTADNGWTD